MKQINQEMKVGDLVGKYPQFANVFDELRIDFCCGGGESLERAAMRKSVDPNYLISRLEEAMEEKTVELPDENWSATELVEYIKRKHHSYVQNEIPVLLKFLNKLSKVHGGNHPELLEINRLFSGAASDLTGHLKREELEAFPLIQKLERVMAGEEITDEQKKRLDPSIKRLIEDHEQEGSRFENIAALSNYYDPPADACNTYRVTFEKLKSFEQDLHVHVHLENNILFKKAEQMLAELN